MNNVFTIMGSVFSFSKLFRSHGICVLFQLLCVSILIFAGLMATAFSQSGSKRVQICGTVDQQQK